MIINKLLSIFLTVALSFSAIGQTNNTLFTFGSTSVDKDEFLRGYNKSNKTNDYSAGAIREYLDLYTKFKLKVRDAEDNGLDTLIQVRRELAKYQNQLMESYFDKAVTNTLIAKTYERLKDNVKVRHVFFRLDPSMPNEDTAAIYKKAKTIRERLGLGEDFAKLATEFSEDPSAKDNAGALGWISYGGLGIYEFEEMAFSTPIGRVSKLFKSKLGYHILKVEDRKPNPGNMNAAHILIKFREKVPSKQEIANRKALADSIHMAIQGGADFGVMAEKYSSDKTTHTKEGVLPEFGVGKMVGEFESAAFALTYDGQVSAPVQTVYGWHIIKRLGRSPMKSLKEMTPMLKSKVTQGPEYKQKKDGHVKYYANKGNLNVFQQELNRFEATLDSSLLRNQWKARFLAGRETPIMSLGTRTFAISEYADYLELNQRAFRAKSIKDMVSKSFTTWKDKMVMDYSYELEDPAYRPLMQEYRDGILLFELTERKVWSKALRDTIGLADFYNANMAKYGGTEKVEFVKKAQPINPGGAENKMANGRVYKCVSSSVAKQVHRDIKRGLSSKEILKKANPVNIKNVEFEQGAFGSGKNPGVDAFWDLGVSKPIEVGGAHYVVEITNWSNAPSENNSGGAAGVYPKNFTDNKGAIISDYQKFLEDKWIDELKIKYPISINEAVLQSMVR